MFTDILRMILYLLPFFSMVTIPMAFLLALLLAFGRLSADSEITAMKASGMGLYSLLPPVLTCALIAYIATTFVTVYALPWGNSSFKKLLLDVIETRATLNLKERIFNDDFPGLVLYVDRYSSTENTMSGILIQDERDPKEPSTIFAERGMIERVPDTKVAEAFPEKRRHPQRPRHDRLPPPGISGLRADHQFDTLRQGSDQKRARHDTGTTARNPAHPRDRR